MIGTLQALLVAVFAVLPGALYTLARENFGATWAWRQTDTATQIFRFLSASALFHAIFAPLTYIAYQTLVVTDALAYGDRISWWWWAAIGAYVSVPYLLGYTTEWSRDWKESSQRLLKRPKRGVKALLSFIGGKDPEPRAWDWFFSKRPVGIVRLQLMNDEWKAGLWADSFASGYGEDGDLYIAETYLIENDGQLQLQEDGRPVPGGVGLLIRWSEVRYLEFSPWLTEETDNGEDGDDG